MKNVTIRNEIIDIAKGLGIILVVLGHLPSVFGYPIYLFHMALFFILSGWCLKESYTQQPMLFVWKRIKSLLVPYAIFIGSAKLLVLVDPLYWKFTIDHYNLLGTLWFLHALFETSCLTLVVLMIFKKFMFPYWGIPLLFLLLAHITSVLEIRLLTVILYRSVFFSLGFVLKTNLPGLLNRKNISLVHFCICSLGIIFLLIMPRFMPVGLSECNYTNFITYGILSLTGSYVALQLCFYIKDTARISKIIQLIGVHTMPIVLFQWIAFWFFDIIVESNPIIVYNDSFFLFAKFLTGIVLPLLVDLLFVIIRKNLHYIIIGNRTQAKT